MTEALNDVWELTSDQFRSKTLGKSAESAFIYDDEGLSRLFFGKSHSKYQGMPFADYMHGMLFSDFKNEVQHALNNNLIENQKTIETLTQLTIDDAIQYGSILNIVGNCHGGELILVHNHEKKLCWINNSHIEFYWFQ